MTAKYAFDVFEAGNETGSLPLVRLSPDDNLVSGEYTHVAFGLGEGVLRIHADHADATSENFARRNYVQFVRVDTDPEQKIGGFFLESGDFAALSRREQGGRILTFRGPGGLSILDRYKLGQAIYAPGQPYRGSYNEHGKWTWSDIAYGAIMVRAIEEGQYNDDVLPYPPFNAVTLGFDRTNDSNGNPWDTLGDYQTDVGTGVLELYADLVRHGIVVQATAELMINGYRSKADFGVDRTSLTFAAGKARFEAGVNIAGEVPKRIHASVERSHVLTRRKDGLYQTFGLGYSGGVTGTGVVYYDFIEVPQTSDAAAVARVAQAHLDRLSAYVDQATVRHVAGGDGVGEYAPGPEGDYWVLDLVTVDTGDADNDFDDAPIEVASIRFLHDEAANWIIETELGAEYVPPEAQKFGDRIVTQVRTTSGGRMELCQPVQVIEEGIQRVGSIAISSAHIDSDDWPDGVQAGDIVVLELTQVGIASQIPAGASGWTNHGSGGVTNDGPGADVGFRLISRVLTTPDLTDTTGWTHTNTERMVGAVYRNVASLAGLVGASISGGSSGLFEWPAVSLSVGDGSSWVFLGGHSNIDAGIGTPAGFDSLGSAVGDGNGVAQSWDSGHGVTAFAGDSVGLSPASAWQCHGIELVASGGTTLSSTGDGHADLVGEGGKAARCDHTHILIADTAPTVDEDGVHGIPRTTLWVRVDDVDTPTSVVAVYVSADDTDGAAVWLELPSGGAAAFVGARAYNSTTQNITNGSGDTHTAATLNSEEFDTDGFHSTSSNTSRMTIPSGKAGKYRVRGHAFFEANATGIRSVCIAKNGTKLRGSATRTLVPGATGGISAWGEWIGDLAVGDYVELMVYQNSGGTRTIGHASLLEIQTVLEIVRLGD